MLDKWYDAVVTHWSTVVNDPTPFAAATMLALIAGWTIRWLFDRRDLNYWRGLVAEYKDKLHDETPIEVAAKMARLEGEIADLKRGVWRMVDLRRRAKFQHSAASLDEAVKTASTFTIACNEISAEAESYARDLTGLFRDNGFHVGVSHISSPHKPSTGLAIIVQNLSDMTRTEQMLDKLLNDSDIDHEVIADSRTMGLSHLLVGRRPEQF